MPLYGKRTGWCRQLTNFRVMPGGYLEARGGFDAIKPSGGTATDLLASGVIATGGHEHTMADGWIFTATTGGTVFSAGLQERGYFTIWDVAANTATNDALYIGASGKFSRVVFYIGQGTMGASVPTFAYEYYNGSTWTALTTTSTPNFASTAEQTLEFATPSDWAPTDVNSLYQYWVRIRMSAENDGFTTKCTQTTQKVYCDWPGMRQIYVSTAKAGTATNNGAVKRYDQAAGVVAWTALSTSLFSGNFARTRFASYRNLLYFLNGKEQKRWDQNALADMGFSKPTTSGATYGVGVAGTLTGLFAYAITYGYGPAGEWGESTYLDLSNSGAIAAKKVTVTLNLTSIPATAEKIYVYRTQDLTNAAGTSSFPMFRIQTLTRDSTGTFPTTFTDDTVDFPFPPVELDIVDKTPPARCKYLTVHKNRLFLANNNQYPGRVWWSNPFEAEAFDTDEAFADFTRSTGGFVTGIVEAFDRVVCFTEDKQFSISNVDQDQPSIFEEPGGVGCIAPDSIQYGFGYLCWLSRSGVYVWDGNNPPERVSDNVSATFGKMSLESHGGSRAVLHNRLYDVHMLTNAGAAVVAQTAEPRMRYDLVTRTWADVNLGMTGQPSPIVAVTAPLGHADAGVRHPLYSVCHTAANTDYAVYLGEYTTADGGSSYVPTVTLHLGPTDDKEWTIDSFYAIYSTDAAWGTPALSHLTTVASVLGSPTGTVNNQAVDAGFDYSRIKGIPSQGTLGTGDVAPTFAVTSSTGGSANGQKLMSLGIVGTVTDASWSGSA